MTLLGLWKTDLQTVHLRVVEKNEDAKMFRISVVIPTYNREKCIKKAIESVLAQEGRGFEIIEVLLIDDGSEDNTTSVVREIPDERIKIYKMQQNSGPAVARNVGVDMAKGEWIAFQDSDDIWYKNKLRKQVEYLNKYEDIDMISHPIKEVFDDGSVITTEAINDDDMIRLLAVRNYYGTPTMLVKRDCFQTLRGFNIELKALEDWEFMLRFSNAYKVRMVPEVLIESRMMQGGVSSWASNYYESRCKMIVCNKDILINHGCFDDAVKSLLIHAKQNDVLEQVGKMLELYLGI